MNVMRNKTLSVGFLIGAGIGALVSAKKPILANAVMLSVMGDTCYTIYYFVFALACFLGAWVVYRSN